MMNDDGPANIRLESPDPKKLEGAELKIGQQHMSEVQDEVIKYVRKHSLLKEAADLWATELWYNHDDR